MSNFLWDALYIILFTSSVVITLTYFKELRQKHYSWKENFNKIEILAKILLPLSLTFIAITFFTLQRKISGTVITGDGAIGVVFEAAFFFVVSCVTTPFIIIFSKKKSQAYAKFIFVVYLICTLGGIDYFLTRAIRHSNIAGYYANYDRYFKSEEISITSIHGKNQVETNEKFTLYYKELDGQLSLNAEKRGTYHFIIKEPKNYTEPSLDLGFLTEFTETFILPGEKNISFSLKSKNEKCFFADVRKEAVKNLFANSGGYGSTFHVPRLYVEIEIKKVLPLWQRVLQRYAYSYVEPGVSVGGAYVKIDRFSNSCRSNE